MLMSSKKTPHIVGCMAAIGFSAFIVIIHLSWAMAELTDTKLANTATMILLNFITLFIIMLTPFFC